MKKLMLVGLTTLGACVFADPITSTLESGSLTITPVASAAPSSAVANGESLPYINSDNLNSTNSGPYDLGAYAELQAGSANSSGLNSGVNNSTALRFDFGGKINPYFGIEGGTTMLTNPSAGDVLAPIQIFDLSAKGYLPLSSWFSLHGQLGAAYSNMGSQNVTSNGQQTIGISSSSAGIKVMLGVGMDMYVTQNFAIVINDYNYLGSGQTDGGGNTNVVLGGLKYDFK